MNQDNISREFFRLLENLKDEEWDIKVDNEWAIKDVVAHLVGWEKECVQILEETWKTKEKPWFLKTDDYNEFNKKNAQEYENYSPKELLKEWKFWQNSLDEKIEKIGENNLRQNPELFEWVFDEGEDGHYLEHFNQIKKVLN